MLKNSPTLGSTGEKNQFQSLQVVTQALGRYYSDPTRAAQVVFIKAATGGTFRIGYNGIYSSTLQYNATVADVQAAVNTIPALSGIKVWTGQPRYANGVLQNEIGYGFEFSGVLDGTVVNALTVDSSSLSGTAEVVVHNYGGPNITWGLQIETGNLFKIAAPPGTYRLEVNLGKLSQSEYLSLYNDSPFGLAQADVWIRQPDSGGNVILEPPFFPARSYSGSTYTFQWMEGVDPVLSTEPGKWDVIRLSSVNFNSWVGQHITRSTIVSVPTTATSPGIKGQVAYDANYMYMCTDTNTWKRSPIGTW